MQPIAYGNGSFGRMTRERVFKDRNDFLAHEAALCFTSTFLSDFFPPSLTVQFPELTTHSH